MVEYRAFSEIVTVGSLTRHRRALHACPELGRCEHETSRYVEAELRRLGLRPKRYGTGIVAEIRGQSRLTVACRADLDALPLTEQNDVPYRSRYEGRMHACGHDGHTAMLLVLAEYCTRVRPPCNVRLIFQPAEEGGGGADELIAQGVLKGVDRIYGLHLDPMREKGRLATCGGGMLAGNCDFSVRWSGKGCHVADRTPGKDALSVAVAFYTQANRLFEERYARHNKFGLCSIDAGTSHNVVREDVTVAGTFRCYDTAYREAFFVELSQLMSDLTRESGVEHLFTAIAAYEPLINPPVLAQTAVEQMGLDVCEPRYTSEDFASYLNCVDGLFLWLGTRDATHTAPLHSPHFDFDEEALVSGVRAYLDLIHLTAEGVL